MKAEGFGILWEMGEVDCVAANQLVKFKPHVAGLTDFQFVEFSRASFRR